MREGAGGNPFLGVAKLRSKKIGSRRPTAVFWEWAAELRDAGRSQKTAGTPKKIPNRKTIGEVYKILLFSTVEDRQE